MTSSETCVITKDCSHIILKHNAVLNTYKTMCMKDISISKKNIMLSSHKNVNVKCAKCLRTYKQKYSFLLSYEGIKQDNSNEIISNYFYQFGRSYMMLMKFGSRIMARRMKKPFHYE